MDELTTQSKEHVLILQTAFQNVNPGEAASQAPLDDKRAPISAFYEDLIHFNDTWYTHTFLAPTVIQCVLAWRS